MIKALFCMIALLSVVFKQRRELALENLALHHQLAVFSRNHKRLRLRGARPSLGICCGIVTECGLSLDGQRWMHPYNLGCLIAKAGVKNDVAVPLFERFHDLCQGQAILIRCPQCGLGLQIPGPYQGHTGQSVTVDPAKLPGDAFIHEAFC